MKHRLDKTVYEKGLVLSRSQAESYIRLGKVQVNGRVVKKSGFMVSSDATITIHQDEQYVSRAALKLASVAEKLQLNFKDKVLLDVGSSTGGFTDYALKRGAIKSIAVEVGSDQLHPSLRNDSRIELHEKTDIRSFQGQSLEKVDMVVIDVSFISLREILPYIKKVITKPNAQIVAMVKPQFEVGDGKKHKGVIKNSAMRRDILKDFEAWAKQHFVIVAKADSEVSGAKGNTERFYLLTF